MFRSIATAATCALALVGMTALPASATKPVPQVVVSGASSTVTCQVGITAQVTAAHGPMYHVQFFGRLTGTSISLPSEFYDVPPKGGSLTGTLFLSSGQAVDGISATLLKVNKPSGTSDIVDTSATLSMSTVSCP